MLIKNSAFVASVFLIILCVTTIRAIPQLGSESPIVDTATIENLKKNISDYLIELEHGGSPHMQLKQIYSASEQIVTGTLYTIEALIATPDGEKKCKIRVLEKPWLDFCKVSLTCENGGFYEVTFNPNQNSLQNVLNTNHFSTSALQKPEVKEPKLTSFKPQQTAFKSPFTSQAPQKFEFKPQSPSQFTVNNVAKPQTFAPAAVNNIFGQNPTLPSNKFEFNPQKPSQFTANIKPQTLSPVIPQFPVSNNFHTTEFQKTEVKKPQFTPFKTQQTDFKLPFTTQAPTKFIPQQPSKFIVNNIAKQQTLVAVPEKFDFKPQQPSQFQANNLQNSQTFSPASFVKQQLTAAPVKFDFKPQTQQNQHQNPSSVFDFKPRPEVQNVPAFLPKEEVLPPVPFDFKPHQQFDQHQFTHPVEPAATAAPEFASAKAPELHVLPFDQLPQGEALNTYLDGLFHDFMKAYDRAYIDEPHEMQHRFNVFKENFHAMLEHSKSDQSSEYSVTQFSDLTQSEFGRILGFDTGFMNATDAEIVPSEPSGQLAGDVGIPEKYDQRDEGIVTRVKHQGDCGACWAFITNAVIEGLCAKRTKKLQEFSEQSLIDCDKSNYECKGGVPVNAYKHIIKRGGLELEEIYPYVYGKSSCHFEPKTVRVKLSGGFGFKKGDEAAMAKWLYKNGPIAVGVNAAPLKYYKRGILNPTESLCSPKKIDHGLTLIGYGVEVDKKTGEKLSYWIAKNSWGTSFGEDGFVRIARGKNACGLALWASSAKLANVENNCLLQGS